MSVKGFAELLGVVLIVLGVITLAGYQVFSVTNVPQVGWIMLAGGIVSLLLSRVVSSS